MFQVKTNERKKPWDPKPEDQKVDGKNYRDGKDQLLRDALRFFELFPDIKTTDVRCHFSVAFPLASNSDEKEVLTKKDFEEEHQDKLLSKLGIVLPDDGETDPQAHMKENYVRLVARYLGQHSHLPSKKASEAWVKGLETLKVAVQCADSVFRFAANNMKTVTEEEDSRNSDAKKAILSDKFMADLKQAKANPKYLRSFQKQNDKIPFAELKIDKQTKLLVHSETKSYPLFGKAVTDSVLRALDEAGAHQGPSTLGEKLTKEKYAFHNEHAEEIDHVNVVNEHCKNCSQCKEVKAIRDLLPGSSNDLLLQIPEEHVQRAIAYGDLKHQGYTECSKRLKSWCTFEDFGNMVNDISH